MQRCLRKQDHATIRPSIRRRALPVDRAIDEVGWAQHGVSRRHMAYNAGKPFWMLTTLRDRLCHWARGICCALPANSLRGAERCFRG